jgi:hypothetical protein
MRSHRVAPMFSDRGVTLEAMCRSIRRLRERDVRATDEEIEAAARQFVRKISGFREPAAANEAAFAAAVQDIAASSRRLLVAITDVAKPPAPLPAPTRVAQGRQRR